MEKNNNNLNLNSEKENKNHSPAPAYNQTDIYTSVDGKHSFTLSREDAYLHATPLLEEFKLKMREFKRYAEDVYTPLKTHEFEAIMEDAWVHPALALLFAFWCNEKTGLAYHEIFHQPYTKFLHEEEPPVAVAAAAASLSSSETFAQEMLKDQTKQRFAQEDRDARVTRHRFYMNCLTKPVYKNSPALQEECIQNLIALQKTMEEKNEPRPVQRRSTATQEEEEIPSLELDKINIKVHPAKETQEDFNDIGAFSWGEKEKKKIPVPSPPQPKFVPILDCSSSPSSSDSDSDSSDSELEFSNALKKQQEIFASIPHPLPFEKDNDFLHPEDEKESDRVLEPPRKKHKKNDPFEKAFEEILPPTEEEEPHPLPEESNSDLEPPRKKHKKNDPLPVVEEDDENDEDAHLSKQEILALYRQAKKTLHAEKAASSALSFL